MFPVIHLGPYTFYSFGLMVGIGIWLSCIGCRSYFRRHRLEVNVATLCMIIVITGFLGAKLDYTLLEEPGGIHTLIRHSPSYLANGGFTYFGGMLAAMVSVAIFIRIAGLPFLKTFDGLFCVALAYGTGRIGCFLAGDGDYGIPTTLPWAVSFPHGIVPTSVRVHPTMLYLSFWEFSIFATLWYLSTSRRETPLPAGTLLGTYLIASGTGRFLVEFLSRNPSIAFGLKEAQVVSAAMAAGGAVLLTYLCLSPGVSATALSHLETSLGHDCLQSLNSCIVKDSQV